MTRIAVVGHRDLFAGTARRVGAAIRTELEPAASGLVGVSFLADGADALFCDEVVRLGGALEAIVPARRYRDGLPAAHRPVYDELLGRASRVHRLEYVESTAESHMEASKLMVAMADELVAVWDGKPARGHGGTADVVAHARARRVPVRVIWPDGAVRGGAPSAVLPP